MTAGALGEERPTLFLRNATGLVRGWSVRDSMIYACLSTNVVTLGMVEWTFQSSFPNGNLLYSILISGVWVSFLVIAYTGLVVTIPRAGGDYVWQSRILGSGDRLRDGRHRMVVHPVAVGADLRDGPDRGVLPAAVGHHRPRRGGGLVRHPQRDLRGDADHDRAGRRPGLDRDGGLRQGAEVVLLRRPGRLRGPRDPAPDHQQGQLRLARSTYGRTSCSASTAPTRPRQRGRGQGRLRRADVLRRHVRREHAAGAVHDVLPAVAELGHHPVRRDPRGQRLPPGVQRHVHRAVDHAWRCPSCSCCCSPRRSAGRST